MPQPNVSATTGVVPAHDFTIAIPTPTVTTKAGGSPPVDALSESGAALFEHGGVWP
jgi:hypothetical protein